MGETDEEIYQLLHFSIIHSLIEVGMKSGKL